MQILNKQSLLDPESWYEHELKFASSSRVLNKNEVEFDYLYNTPECSSFPLLDLHSISCSTLKHNYRASLTMPNYLTIRLILDGSLIARYSGQIYLIEKNDLQIFLPGINFEYKIGPENFCKSILLTIHGSALNVCLSVSRLSTTPVMQLNERQQKKFSELMENAKSFYQNNLVCQTGKTAGYCMNFIQELENEILAYEVPQKEPLAQILHTLSAEMDKKLTIQNIASRFGLSTCGLTRLFRKKMQKSFHEYLMNLRMEKAKELLSKGNVSVKETASLTGFSSQENFSTAFRIYYGLPPREFSKKYKERQIVCDSLKNL